MTDRPPCAPTEPSPAPIESSDVPTADPGQEKADRVSKELFDAGYRIPVPGLIPIAPEAQGLSLDTLSQEERSKLQLIVRGGTTTSAFDNEMAQKVADSKVRQAESDADKKIAQIPIEQGGGLMFEQKFCDETQSPRVCITYKAKGREEDQMQQLCELVSDDTSGDHMFIFVCPECFKRGIPSAFCQIHVRAGHRAWHLDTRTAGTIKSVKNTDAPGGMEFYQHAGDIMDTDVLRCDAANCGCAYKIHKNILYRV